MSLIDDVAKKRIKRGADFKKGARTGTFGKDLDRAVIESPTFKALADNKDAFKEVVGEYEKYIKEGSLTKSMENDMLRKLKVKDANLSTHDRTLARAIIKHLGKTGASQSNAAAGQKAVPSAKATKQAARAAAKKAQLKRDPNRGALPEFLQKKRGSVSIKANPWAANPNKPGGGGGIASGQGGGSLASNPSSGGGSYRPPSLLR